MQQCIRDRVGEHFLVHGFMSMKALDEALDEGIQEEIGDGSGGLRIALEQLLVLGSQKLFSLGGEGGKRAIRVWRD